MKAFKPSKSVIIEINAKLCYSAFLGFVSYMIWPTSMKWYGFGLLSNFVGLAATGLAINAIKQIFKSRTFENDQKEFMAQGKQVKSSSLASSERMRNDGIIRNGK